MLWQQTTKTIGYLDHKEEGCYLGQFLYCIVVSGTPIIIGGTPIVVSGTPIVVCRAEHGYGYMVDVGMGPHFGYPQWVWV